MIFINSHSTKLDGPINYVERYLLQKGYSTKRISHPLDTNSYPQRNVYVNGTSQFTADRKPGSLAYISDFLFTINSILKASNIEIYFGSNNFDTLPGIIARYIFRKKIGKIIYFASDYSVSRFQSVIMNSIYALVEKIAINYSDLVVSNTKRAESQRMLLGLNKIKSIVIPNGVKLKQSIFMKKKINKSKFIYVGSITKEHGLYRLIEKMSEKIKELIIIGSGEDLNRIKNLLKRRKIKCSIINDLSHEAVLEFMQDFNGIGLAPYNNHSDWTYYCSPLKVVEYISCGLPVIISDVPEISTLVHKRNLGVTFNQNNYSKLITDFDTFDVSNFFKKSEKFYTEFNYNNLLNKLSL